MGTASSSSASYVGAADALFTSILGRGAGRSASLHYSASSHSLGNARRSQGLSRRGLSVASFTKWYDAANRGGAVHSTGHARSCQCLSGRGLSVQGGTTFAGVNAKSNKCLSRRGPSVATDALSVQGRPCNACV